MANVVDVYTHMFIKNGRKNVLDLHQKRKKNLSVSIRCTVWVKKNPPLRFS